jgi:hypothetical protein
VATWRQLVEMDQVIDKKPTVELVAKIVETRIRNLQAFRELKEYNDKGVFVNRHPLVVRYSARQKYKMLLRGNPDRFLETYANVRENVKRYKSYLNNKKRSKDQHKNDKNNLFKYEQREALLKEILTEDRSYVD